MSSSHTVGHVGTAEIVINADSSLVDAITTPRGCDPEAFCAVREQCSPGFFEVAVSLGRTMRPTVMEVVANRGRAKSRLKPGYMPRHG